jgi:hypothetical protein
MNGPFLAVAEPHRATPLDFPTRPSSVRNPLEIEMNALKNLSFMGAVAASVLFGAVSAYAQAATTSPCSPGQTGCETQSTNPSSNTNSNDAGQPATTNGGDVGGSNNAVSPGSNNNSGGVGGTTGGGSTGGSGAGGSGAGGSSGGGGSGGSSGN